MMDTEDVVEQTRVLSLLSERYHLVSVGGKNYACFAGMVLPADLGQVVFLWAMVDAKYYAKLLENRMAEILQLNGRNQDIANRGQAESMAWYLKDRMQGIMRTWGPEHFEDVLG